MAETSGASTWVVDSQVMRTKVDASQNVNEGFEIAFHTGQGHAGTVFVPMNSYTPEKAKAAIAAQAAIMDSVGALTSES